MLSINFVFAFMGMVYGIFSDLSEFQTSDNRSIRCVVDMTLSNCVSDEKNIVLFTFAQPLRKGERIYLVQYKGKDHQIIDSIIVNNRDKKEFSFSPNVELMPGIYELHHDSTAYPFVIGLKATRAGFTVEGSTVFGGREQEANNAFVDRIRARQLMHQNQQELHQNFHRKQQQEKWQGKAYSEALRTMMRAKEQLYFDWLEGLFYLQKDYGDTYVAHILVPLYLSGMDTRKISTIDMPSSELQRYIINHFFDGWSFHNETIINNPLYDLKIEEYLSRTLQLYRNDPSKLNEAVDKIMYKTYVNKTVELHTLDVLSNIFLKRGPESVVLHLYENHIEGCTESQVAVGNVTIKRMRMMREMKPGIAAPNFEISDIDGNSVNLHDDILSGEQAMTLIVFWASWCTHCQTEIPKIKELSRQYDDNQLKIVLVSLDDDKNALATFVEKSGMQEYIHLSDYKRFQSTAAEAYFVFGTPMSFLIKEGKLLGKYKNSLTPFKEIDKKLNHDRD